jgi:hypothetical protein
MEVFSPLPDELTPAPDTSNPVRVIGELCLKPHMNVVRFRVCLKEKSNDHLLLILHPGVKNPKVQRRYYFYGSLLSRIEARMPSSGGWKLHKIGCVAMHESLLGKPSI